MPDAAAPREISGRAVLHEVRDTYRDRFADAIRARDTHVLVVRFTPVSSGDPEWTARMDAARISADQKVRLFADLGATPELHTFPDDIGLDTLAALVTTANHADHIAGLIVQTPAPSQLRPLLNEIAPGKDLDSLSPFALRRACATADGILRIAEPYLDRHHQVAVVGSSGFVGSGVLALLHEAGHDPLQLDAGDDLRQLRDADIVLSTTGVPGLLTDEHIHPGHQLVVDSGFYPTPAGHRGDLSPAAAALPQRLTPVPGGIGPVEMAILAERLVQHTVAPELTAWRYHGLDTTQPTLTTAEHTAALTRAATEPTREPQDLGTYQLGDDNGYELADELGLDP